MKKTFLLFLMVAALLQIFNGCKKDKDENTDPTPPADLQIAIFSDPHYHDPSLGISGSAFEAYLLQDRKMIAQSKQIIESVVQTLKSSNASIILVPGDLTKDGEKTNHEMMAALFTQLESAGKRVFVIPGNHDINNPQSFSYSGSATTPVPTVTPTEFATIYGQFGFNEALYRDNNSLSYIVALNSNTWLLAMDACRYKENTTTSVTGGKFSDATYQWIKDKLTEAKNKNIRVLGMIHHGLIEHYSGQSTLFAEYLLDDWQNKSTELANLGLKVVFTGHFHAQDIVRKDVNSSSFMFDVETGSLVTWPVPYRTITYTTTNKLTVHTSHVTTLTGYPDFEEFSRNFLQQGMDTLTKLQLMSPPYSLPYQEAQMVAPLVVAGFMAHYHGDEAIDPQTQAGVNQLIGLGGMAALVGMSVQSMFTDPAPADQNIGIDLSSGVVTPL
ncbi:MAG: metallophosphoesterase [Bacteroidota bacterium]